VSCGANSTGAAKGVEMTSWMRLVLAVLATWRVAHLLSSEDGPADLMIHLRRRMGAGVAGRLMDCFQCLSVWVAVPLAFFVGTGPVDIVVSWLALSGAACLLERRGQESVVIQRAAQRAEGEHDDGMLRSETGSAEGSFSGTDDGGRYAERQ